MSTAREYQQKQVAEIRSKWAFVRNVLNYFVDLMLTTEIQEASPDSHAKGTAWQLKFADMARERGLSVEPGTGRADLRVAGKKVQCKNINAARGKWLDVSNMRPVKANDGLRGYLAHELDVLALLHCGKIFLIPRASICDERGLIAGKVTTSFAAQFENNWGVFDAAYVPPPTDRQQTLFDEEENQ